MNSRRMTECDGMTREVGTSLYARAYKEVSRLTRHSVTLRHPPVGQVRGVSAERSAGVGPASRLRCFSTCVGGSSSSAGATTCPPGYPWLHERKRHVTAVAIGFEKLDIRIPALGFHHHRRPAQHDVRHRAEHHPAHVSIALRVRVLVAAGGHVTEIMIGNVVPIVSLLQYGRFENIARRVWPGEAMRAYPATLPSDYATRALPDALELCARCKGGLVHRCGPALAYGAR